jgi:1-deoxy-D-xylulose-5-phosphate reductoisomerase
LKFISILGSTGSIGQQTLDVVAQHPEQFQVVGLAAGSNWELLVEQMERFKPSIISVASKELAEKIKMTVTYPVQIHFGIDGLMAVAAHPKASFVVSAIVGSAGLAPTLKAIEEGKTIGLANKETLVTAGHIVMDKAREHNVKIIPIDSEHSAIFQCLQGERSASIRKLILTASGGSFRDKNREDLKNVTLTEALNHPNWKMGAKITIDSATMMNKGFEVIEAHWLFELPFTQIETILHRESIIHSMVEFVDHAILAQLGTPDMRVPIQYALTYPNRIELDSPELNLADFAALHFAPMDLDRYPALKLAYQCGIAGGTMPTVLNAANEVIVGRFLNGEIKFAEIENKIEMVLMKHECVHSPQLEQILEIDQWARSAARLI